MTCHYLQPRKESLREVLVHWGQSSLLLWEAPWAGSLLAPLPEECKPHISPPTTMPEGRSWTQSVAQKDTQRTMHLLNISLVTNNFSWPLPLPLVTKFSDRVTTDVPSATVSTLPSSQRPCLH